MCDIETYMQFYDAMLSFYVQEKCWIFISIICSFSLDLCEVFYQIEYDQSIMNYHTSMQELLWISSALLRLLKIIFHLDIHSK